MPLTVIQAPRGAGKSALVHTWLSAAESIPGTAVVVPEVEDGCTEEGLWISVDSALRSAGFSAPRDAAERAPYERVAHMLDAVVGDLILVLDHPKRADGGRLGGQLLALLHRHHNLHLVLCSRSTSVFGDFAGVDVDYQVIGREDLLFTRAETGEWLRQSGVELADSVVDAVHLHLGGVPRLVHAMAPIIWRLAAVSRAQVGGVLDEVVLRMVQAELRDPQCPESLVAAMTAGALCGSVSSDALAALTGAAEFERDLADVNDLGLLRMVRADDRVDWELVPALGIAAATILTDQPAERAVPHIRALGLWLREGGDFRGALRCSLKVEDWDLAWPLLRENWSKLVATDMDLLRDVLVSLPADLAEQDPPISAGRAMFAGVGAGFVSSMGDLADCDEQLLRADGTPMDLRDVVIMGTVQVMMLRLTGEFQAAAALIARLVAHVDSSGEAQRRGVGKSLAMMRVQWAITLQLAGQMEASDEQFRRADEHARKAGSGGVAAEGELVSRVVAGRLALNLAVSGETIRSEALARAEAEFSESGGSFGPRPRVAVRVARVLNAWHRLDLDEAQRQLPLLGYPADSEELWAPMVVARSGVEMALGRPEVGLDLLNRARVAHPRLAPAGSLALAMVEFSTANLYLSSGRGNEALAIIDGAAVISPALRVCRARTLLLAGESAAALAEVQGLALAEGTRSTVAVNALVVAASAQVDLDQADSARNSLSRAVALTELTGAEIYLHSLPKSHQDRLLAAGVVGDSLRESWRRHSHTRLYPDEITLVSLTPRELRVIQLLAEGQSSTMMAQTLFVSQNTVKSQLRSAYRKLEANTKEGAIQTARRLRLI